MDFNLGAMAPRGMQVDLPKPKGGMFGGDGKFGIGQAIVAALNGYLASQPGGAGAVGRSNIDMMAQMGQDKRRMALQEQQYQRSRADQNADWLSHQQWERANPAPGQPSEFEQSLMDSGVKPGTPEWAKAMATRRDNFLDPVVMTQQGPMLRSQLVGGGQPAAPGVTFTPIGGPTPPASGGFSGY